LERRAARSNPAEFPENWPIVDRGQGSAGAHRTGLSIVGFFAGDLSRRTMLFVVIPLIVIFFFGSLALAVVLLP